MGVKQIITDIKTYLSIKIKNKKRFPESIVLSYVPVSIYLSKKVTIKPGVLFSDRIKSIGYGTYIGNNSSLFNCLSIGNYCSISHDVKIGLDNHELNNISTSPLLSKKKEIKPTIIEHDVLISANALVLSGITIGTGSIIGAGSFVNKDVPPYSIVVGSPAKIIRHRYNKEQIDKLLLTEWWNLTQHELLEMKNVFDNPEGFINKINKSNV